MKYKEKETMGETSYNVLEDKNKPKERRERRWKKKERGGWYYGLLRRPAKTIKWFARSNFFLL